MLLITIYALTGDDIRILAFDKTWDKDFLAMNLITITIFLLELILSSIGIKGYFLSFFFWFDLISTVAIFMDIEEIWFGIVNDDNSDQSPDAT